MKRPIKTQLSVAGALTCAAMFAVGFAAWQITVPAQPAVRNALLVADGVYSADKLVSVARYEPFKFTQNEFLDENYNRTGNKGQIEICFAIDLANCRTAFADESSLHVEIAFKFADAVLPARNLFKEKPEALSWDCAAPVVPLQQSTVQTPTNIGADDRAVAAVDFPQILSGVTADGNTESGNTVTTFTVTFTINFDGDGTNEQTADGTNEQTADGINEQTADGTDVQTYIYDAFYNADGPTGAQFAIVTTVKGY